MCFLRPLVKTADMVFVLLLELLAVYMEEVAQQTAADWVII